MTTKFGPYRLLKRIASGGMGEVYLAVLEREGGFAKTVALKTMLPTVESRPEFAKLFEAEAALAAMLNHVNIVQIFDHGWFDDRSYLTMEFVEGPDLSTLLQATGKIPLSPGVVAEVGVQLCRALGHAHSRRDLQGRPMGIVHGDISPPNILLSFEGQVKLADFGLAGVRSLVAREGLVTGKYAYMSPEQAASKPLTPRSDLFSLGLVLYEMFTAQRAYSPADSAAIAVRDLHPGSHPPAITVQPTIPEPVSCWLDRALSLEPRDRFPSAGEMSQALRDCCPPCGPEKLSEFVHQNAPSSVTRLGLAPEPTELADRPVIPAGKGRHSWVAALLVLVVVAWGAGLGFWIFHTPPRARPDPPASRLPKAPAGLSVQLIDSLSETNTQEGAESPSPAATRPSALAAPPRQAWVLLSLDQRFRVFLDHRAAEDNPLPINDLKPHLINLLPKQGKRPEVTIRLSPPDEKTKNWSAVLHSTPWMKIRLDRQPAGQTPRSNLVLPPGRSTLFLERGKTFIQLGLEVRAGK